MITIFVTNIILILLASTILGIIIRNRKKEKRGYTTVGEDFLTSLSVVILIISVVGLGFNFYKVEKCFGSENFKKCYYGDER